LGRISLVECARLRLVRINEFVQFLDKNGVKGSIGNAPPLLETAFSTAHGVYNRQSWLCQVGQVRPISTMRDRFLLPP
jgi:hypothetical protein